ncbi:MAG: hypothetical protein HKN13_12540, partial [Rhodothermales bacterium]|nr:hypothetical protein [Rhodothermales bacterium]
MASAFSLLFGSGADAQQVSSRLLAESSGVQRVAFDVTWPMSLGDQIDSLKIAEIDNASYAALSRGLIAVSENVDLVSRSAPSIVIRETQFDEIAIELSSDSLIEALAQPSVELVSIGYFRKQLVGSVQVRLVDYDRERGVLRRYRRVVVEIEQPGLPLGRLGSANSRKARVTQSVLSSGTVFKIPIVEDGVYRISRQLLVELGLQPDAVEPNRVQVFSNGGAPLPASNAASRVDDLAELPVFVVGGGDGAFADSDEVTFFAQGPTGWRYESSSQFEHYVNPFDLNNYIFIKVGSGESRRLSAPGQNPAVADATFSQSTGRFFIDFDEFNWSKDHGSGLTWVSDPIQVSGRLDILSGVSLPGGLPGELQVSGVAAISSNPITSVRFNRGSETVATVRAAFGISTRSDQPT